MCVCVCYLCLCFYLQCLYYLCIGNVSLCVALCGCWGQIVVFSWQVSSWGGGRGGGGADWWLGQMTGLGNLINSVACSKLHPLLILILFYLFFSVWGSSVIGQGGGIVSE